ncbi:GIY-YIG nuclease family protein [Pseudomonas sp. lyk4-R2A-10]|uniref:GIY-YIG nuclease family protein n=1 Tax=Pseudomonas sp. lyk4-R2A-10 TaxID=3040315 RepID=UPI00255794A8|nr:GIY-YIG nuclease family protein [Pseudomonas sp. lyk4-R2A-10]
MNREAIKGALALKSSLQAAIDSGEIKNRDHLMEIAASHGLTVTRNGIDYAGFQCESGQRLRVRLQFNDRPPKVPRVKGPKPPKIKDGFWIYALIAYSKDGKRKACYVGQAANPPKRFREHFRSQREGRGSYALFQWAALEQVEVQAVVLTWAAETQSNATYFEGYWLQRAQIAGFETPDSQNWGQLPRPESLPGQPTHWPTAEVQANSILLSEVVLQGITPEVLKFKSKLLQTTVTEGADTLG